jgi:hypothetical protein
MGAIPLKRVRGVAKASVILVGATALMSLVELLARQAVTGEADDYLAGRIDADEFTESILGYAMVGVVSGMLSIAAAVLTIIWMYRVAANHRALHRGGTWGPGWAIGGWFLPPLIYVIPTLMLRELWKASDPEIPIGSDWRRASGSPLPIVWFVLYTIVPFISFASEAGGMLDELQGSETTIAERITGDQTADIVVALFTVAAAAVFIILVRQLTDRHRRLTGEAVR